MPGELMHTGRSDGDPIFVVLDLGRYSTSMRVDSLLWPIASIDRRSWPFRGMRCATGDSAVGSRVES